MKYWLWLPECRTLRPVRTDAAAAIQSHRRCGERGTPPYQSATDTTDTSTWLSRGPLSHPQIRPASCSWQLFSHLFRYNQEGEHVPVFHHFRDLHVMAVDAQSRPHGFFYLLESRVHHQYNWCNCKSPLTSNCVQWKPVTWRTHACHTENLPSFSGFY